MVTDKDLGWSKVMRELYRLSKKEVTVGIQSGTMTEDGETTLARIAAVHEFGGTITQQADTVTINRKLKRDGSFANGGRFVKKKRSNFVTTAVTGWKRIHIPSRPFLRTAIDNNKNAIARMAQKEVGKIIDGEQDANFALAGLGQYVEGLVQRNFVTGNFAPNAPSTIRKKRSSRPLIDTGHLRQSIRYVIRQKGTEK